MASSLLLRPVAADFPPEGGMGDRGSTPASAQKISLRYACAASPPEAARLPAPPGRGCSFSGMID
ncbi:hypothetical protein HMPREF0372_00014 [Flavonifractor plautii ATCC 29863]|uniref:Uncharacterized protein n=1 Tax=Flavonifractor plautii ATCC 29863 TaxID=411475 RepID=G9YKK3_FLAPL|nr:hypothetical protein HMPREF0372_00014 [Flavonifractor plautii ATCC 29863]